MKEKWTEIFQIFWIFFKIGPATFGGGFAMIPLLEKEIVDKKKWLKREDVFDLLALSQSAPGAIAINVSTFIGYRMGGGRGAIAALVGISIPTFFIVLSLCILYTSIKDNPKVAAAFISIRVSIVALIIYAAIKVGRTALVDKSTIGIFIIGVPALFFIHPLLIILLGALSGVLFVLVKRRLGYKVALDHHQKKDDDNDDFMYFMGAGI